MTKTRKCSWTICGTQKYGYFHQFGMNCASDAEGCGVQWTDAIVEDMNGNIEMVTPSCVQFLPKNFTNEDYEKHIEMFGF